MIGFKCDFYYSNSEFANVPMGTKYPANTFIITDTNKYFTAVTEADTSMRPTEKQRWSGGTVQSREKFVEYLKGWLGNDYYYIYGARVPWVDYNEAAGKEVWLNYSIPSARAMYPNWNNMDPINIDTRTGCCGWYFTSLNKLLVLSSNSIWGFYYDNGEWVIDYSFYYDYFNQIDTYGVSDILIYRGGDLSDYRSWRDFSGGYTWDTEFRGYELQYFGARPGRGETFHWLFDSKTGTPVEPDFIGEQLPPDNPFEPGGDSGPGELPPGTFDDTSDAIPDSSLPTLSAANTGFTRIYNPSLSQVQELARYLWTDETILETIWNKIRQYFENPMDAIIGFNVVPVAVPNGGTKNFALMYIDTGVSMTAAASQFVDQDCGTVKLERYYGSALDQSPYTKVSCFLPYIGMVELNTDEVMGATLQVKYRIDIVTGACVAKIIVDGSVLYQYSGHCAINIPIASSDFSTYVSAIISVATLGIGAALGASAGAAAGAAGKTVADASQETGNVVKTTIDYSTTERNPVSGRQITTGTVHSVETVEYPPERSSTKASFHGLSPSNIANTAGQVMGSKPGIAHSGSFSGNSGYLGVRRPFLIIERPNMCLPKNFQTLNGYPAMITMKLGDCTGYTRVQQVQLTGLPATNPEQAEILTLLKSGVVF